MTGKNQNEEKGPATTLSKKKRRQRARLAGKWVPRMTRAQAVAEVERTWGAKKRRTAKPPRMMRYVAGPFGPPIGLADLLAGMRGRRR